MGRRHPEMPAARSRPDAQEQTHARPDRQLVLVHVIRCIDLEHEAAARRQKLYGDLILAWLQRQMDWAELKL
jgi:hypothetical protein